MRKFQKIGVLGFLCFYLLAGLIMFSPLESSAGIFDVKDITFTPQIGIPGSEFNTSNSVPAGSPGVSSTTGEAVMRSDLLAKYIIAFYNWGLTIVGIIAVVTLMAAGLLWITSAGKSESVSTAKKMITGSLTGLTLLLGSYFLLNTINPNLVNLPAIEMALIEKTSNGCCVIGNINKMTTSQGCKDGEFDENKVLNSQRKCETTICCASTTNICFDTAASSCPSPSYKQLTGRCSSIATCRTTTLSCKGKENVGAVWHGSADTEDLTLYYCYGGTIYLSPKGKNGEPCGTKSDAPNHGICITKNETCSDENNIGGRRCEDNLKCCLDSGIW